MEAKSAAELPTGSNWQYEPKWDGFRCLAFRDNQKIELQSKAGRSLTRYFPDIVHALKSIKAPRFVIDGELCISIDGNLSFERLLERMNPSSKRVMELAQKHPAVFLIFDILVSDDREPLVNLCLRDRRARLEVFADTFLSSSTRIQLSPATTDRQVAQGWFDLVGQSLEGVIAKRLDRPYDSGGRGSVVKVKKRQTLDAVVGGFTYASDGLSVASILLGLFDETDSLRYVGGTRLTQADGRRVLKELESIEEAPGFVRRNSGRFISTFPKVWIPVMPVIVVEVSYDRFTGGHFRHGTKFLQWRPDKSATDCRFE
jgi:ATP-dependent DNA ligase